MNITRFIVTIMITLVPALVLAQAALDERADFR